MIRPQFTIRGGFIFLTAALCLWAVAIEKIDIKRDHEGLPTVEAKTRLRWHFKLHRFRWSIHDLDNDTKKTGSHWVLRAYNVPTDTEIVYDNEPGHWRHFGTHSCHQIYFDYREQAKASRAFQREIRLFQGPFFILSALILFAGSLLLFEAYFNKVEGWLPESFIGIYTPVASLSFLAAFFCAFLIVVICGVVFCIDVFDIVTGFEK